MAYMGDKKTLKGFSKGKEYDMKKNILQEKCDIVVVAAKQLTVDQDLAKNFKCKVVLEASDYI